LFTYLVLFSLLMCKDRKEVFLFILVGSLATIILSLILIALVRINFEVIFVGIHNLIFPQGNWEFHSKTTLIQLYPEKFWIDSFFIFMILTLSESLIVSIVCLFILQRLKSKKIK
jgi:uncharacterized membrane protein